MSLVRVGLFCTLAAAAALTPGCQCELSHRNGTPGEMGNARFAWDEGIFGCLFGCNADNGMAQRAEASLVVLNYDELPYFTVSSDNPAVADFTHDSTTNSSFIHVTSGTPGTARVTLADASTGDVIDVVAIDVRAVDAIELSSPDYVTTFTIMLGGEETLWFDLRDDRGRELEGYGGVDYSFSGGLSASEIDLVDVIDQILIGLFVGDSNEFACVTALALGSGSLVLTAPSGAVLDLPVAIVDESAVARVALSTTFDGNPVAPDDVLTVDAAAFDASDEIIHAPNAMWSITPGVVSINVAGSSYASLQASAPGSATLTCTVGAASDTFDVTFE